MFWQHLRRYLIITLACGIYALAFNWCYLPNKIAYGGFTGIAQVINTLFGYPPVGLLVFCMNIPLFAIHWKLFGGKTLPISLFAMSMASFSIDLLARFHTFAPMEPLLACIYGGGLLGLSIGLIVLQGASTGGTNMLARLLKHPLPWLPFGKVLLGLDLVSIAIAVVAFRSLDSALYGIVALYLSTLVLDTVLYGLNKAKVAYIITDQTQTVLEALVSHLGRGVTVLHGEGAWSGASKEVLLCAFKQRQIVTLKQTVKDTDPNAFLIVCTAHEVLGRGFGQYKENDI